jgi:hypothetical protein
MATGGVEAEAVRSRQKELAMRNIDARLAKSEDLDGRIGRRRL